MSEFPARCMILNGFDRSGSSAICRTLSQHPEIELIFQPFNSGPIRRKMYQILSDDNATREDHAFFTALTQGRLDSDYIESDWHKKYSTTREIIEGRLHIVKTTLNHLTVEWMQQYYPTLEMWGIWRDPMAILASIERNRFGEKWYSGAVEEIAPTIEKHAELKKVFGELIEDIDSECQATAFLIATRSYYFFSHLDADKCVRYEGFARQPNIELGRVGSHYDLASFDFSRFSDIDWNILGKSFQKGAEYSELIAGEDLAYAQRVFDPLRELYNRKFGPARRESSEET